MWVDVFLFVSADLIILRTHVLHDVIEISLLLLTRHTACTGRYVLWLFFCIMHYCILICNFMECLLDTELRYGSCCMSCSLHHFVNDKEDVRRSMKLTHFCGRDLPSRIECVPVGR